MADQTIKVGKTFTGIQVGQGDFTLFLNQNSQYFTVSRSANGDNSIVSNRYLRFSGPATIYVKGTNEESFVVLSDFFKVSSSNNGSAGSYTFSEPLILSGSNVSLALSQNLVTDSNDSLDLAQSIMTGNLTVRDNGLGFGAVDIRNQDGYFSISEDGGTAANLLAVLGFVDSTTTFRIRNITGGYITFNHLIQYEGTYSPADDKDLVPLATLNQVKQELLNIIQSLPAGIQWIGEISNTSTEVIAQPQLLTDFVQAQRQRAPQDGDLVRTSDSFGFIYSSSNWVDFGQISISIATTTSAGLMMFGTADGELQNLGGGKAKVIGWDTVKQALQDLDSRLTNLNNNAVTLSTSQTISGGKTFTGNAVFNNRISVNTGSGITDYVMRFIGDNWSSGQATTLVGFWKGGLQAGYKMILNGANFNYAELHGLTLISNMKDPTQDSHGANKRYVDNQINTISNGTKPFGTVIKAGLNSQEVKFSPDDDSTKRLRFSNSSVGTNCKFILDFEDTIVSENVPDPTSDTQLSNKRYVDAKVEASTRTFQSTDTITTANLPAGEYGYKLSIL